MKRHWILEPHVDDAYLSLHQHMIDWLVQGDEVTIASVFSGTRQRANDARKYAAEIGAFWIGYGYDEERSLTEPFQTRFVFRSPEGRPRTDYIVYTPTGIEHPVHQAVHNWVNTDFCYLDIPYAYKDRNRQILRKWMTHQVVSRKTARPEKRWFWQCFPDQIRFFGRVSPCTYLNKPEIIVEP